MITFYKYASKKFTWCKPPVGVDAGGGISGYNESTFQNISSLSETFVL